MMDLQWSISVGNQMNQVETLTLSSCFGKINTNGGILVLQTHVPICVNIDHLTKVALLKLFKTKKHFISSSSFTFLRFYLILIIKIN